MRLLWIENQPEFVRLVRDQFLSVHLVTVVASLAQARQMLEEQSFDAILLDYDLDDGKGSSLLEEIRGSPTRPPVIATSAHEYGNEVLMEAGADAVCSKGDFSQIGAVLAEMVRVEPMQ